MLGDYGFSIDSRATRPTTRLGTLEMLAPELLPAGYAHSKESYAAEVDIWALGVVLWEVIAGDAPFPARTHAQLELAILRGAIYPPSFSPGARAFLARCLEKNRARRPSAKELLEHPWLHPDAAAQPRSHAGARLQASASARDRTSTPTGATVNPLLARMRGAMSFRTAGDSLLPRHPLLGLSAARSRSLKAAGDGRAAVLSNETNEDLDEIRTIEFKDLAGPTGLRKNLPPGAPALAVQPAAGRGDRDPSGSGLLLPVGRPSAAIKALTQRLSNTGSTLALIHDPAASLRLSSNGGGAETDAALASTPRSALPVSTARLVAQTWRGSTGAPVLAAPRARVDSTPGAATGMTAAPTPSASDSPTDPTQSGRVASDSGHDEAPRWSAPDARGTNGPPREDVAGHARPRAHVPLRSTTSLRMMLSMAPSIKSSAAAGIPPLQPPQQSQLQPKASLRRALSTTVAGADGAAAVAPKKAGFWSRDRAIGSKAAGRVASLKG